MGIMQRYENTYFRQSLARYEQCRYHAGQFLVDAPQLLGQWTLSVCVCDVCARVISDMALQKALIEEEEVILKGRSGGNIH